LQGNELEKDERRIEEAGKRKSEMGRKVRK
jgi:hypothetical protein